MSELKYYPDIFFNPSAEEARKVIVSPIGDIGSDERWNIETKWLAEHIKFDSDNDLIIDYGCGGVI